MKLSKACTTNTQASHTRRPVRQNSRLLRGWALCQLDGPGGDTEAALLFSFFIVETVVMSSNAFFSYFLAALTEFSYVTLAHKRLVPSL